MSKQTIGEFLSIQRKAKGLTQQEVADLLGISNKTLSSWESGRSYPDILTLPELAEIYGVTVDDILSGERTQHDNLTGEISETSQKKLLKNAANRYSVKCSALAGIGIGGAGIFVLALFLGFVALWLFILFAVISVLTELTVIILFVIFEKVALLIEEERSRYSLIIKRMTYKAAFKIVCAVCVSAILCAVVLFQLSGGLSLWLTDAICALILIAIASVFLVWLSRRGKEFYTAEESAASARNKKLALKLLIYGGAISVVLFAVSSVLSTVEFTHIEKDRDLPKDEFIRTAQTVAIDVNDAEDYGIKIDGGDAFGGYFVDIETALSNPIERLSSGKKEYAYHIEGALYLRYNLNYEINCPCYISYIPNVSEAFEVTFSYGRILFRDKAKFMQTHPDPTAEDLLSGIRNEEVFFVFDNPFEVNSVTTPWGVQEYTGETYIEVTDDRYSLINKVVRSYPFIVMIGWGAVLVTAIVCICIYAQKRTAIL